VNSTRLMCVPDSLASSVEVILRSKAFILDPGFSATLGRAETLLCTLARMRSIAEVLAIFVHSASKMVSKTHKYLHLVPFITLAKAKLSPHVAYQVKLPTRRPQRPPTHSCQASRQSSPAHKR